MDVLGLLVRWSNRDSDSASRSPALFVVQWCRREMGVSTLCCWPCERHRRCRLFLLVTLSVLLAAPKSAVGQNDSTIDGCARCPAEQYLNLDTGRCEQCTKCLGSLEERLPCAHEIPDLCDVLGQFDRLCCEEYEYEAYGECVLDCRFCKGSGRCKEGLTECDCPSGTYGRLCEFIDVPSPEPPKATTTPEGTHQTTTERSVPLETWHFALIGLGIVVGVVGFATLCVVGSFCQYHRRVLHRVSKPTVSSSVILDGRSSSTATVSSNSSNDSTHYLIAPLHTRICSHSQRLQDYP